MKKITKLFNLKLKSVDEDNKSVRFIISTNEVDRYGEVVDQKSWNFKEFLKNPIVLWGHDPEQPENVLGQASDLMVDADGSKTYATLNFDTEINPKADLVFRQLVKRTLRTVSVGFRNHTFEWEQDVPVLKDNDLLEISVVPIPANPGAVALDYKAAGMNAKDAQWLLDSMRREAELLDEQLKHDDNVNKDDKAVEEVKTQVASLLDAVNSLAASLDTFKTETTERLDATAKKLDELATKDPEPKGDDEKKGNEGDPTPPAKGGDNDQPGAGADDEFDEDAELTPEDQAAIDAEFADAESDE